MTSSMSGSAQNVADERAAVNEDNDGDCGGGGDAAPGGWTTPAENGPMCWCSSDSMLSRHGMLKNSGAGPPAMPSLYITRSGKVKVGYLL